MCAGDAARPIYSKLFGSHFEPLSALNLLQENHLKGTWSTGDNFAQNARNENKQESVSLNQFLENFGQRHEEQCTPECGVISLSKFKLSNTTQEDSINDRYAKFASDCSNEDGCGLQDNLISPLFSSSFNLESVNTSVPCNANNEFSLEINGNLLPSIMKQKENSVNISLLKTNDLESKYAYNGYSQINSNCKKLCNFSREKVKNANSSPSGSLRMVRRRLRKKLEYRYCDMKKKPEKYFLFNNFNKPENRSPNSRRVKHNIKHSKIFEIIFENYQNSLRKNSDLPTSGRKQTSDSMDINLRFSERKPTRRNSISQISFDGKNKSQNDTKITRRRISNEPSSSSLEECHSTKYKTRRKSDEFFKESTQNTVKLIDKILDEPYIKYSKPIKSLSFDRTFTRVPSRCDDKLIISHDKPRKGDTADSEYSFVSKESNESKNFDIFPQEKNRSISVLRRRSSSITRPASLDIPFQYDTLQTQSNSCTGTELATNRIDGVSCSLDGLIFGTDCRNDRHAGVNSFLERLDKVLSDLVEEETKKIVTMEVPCNHKLYMDRTYVSSVSYGKKNPACRESNYNAIDKMTERSQKVKRYKSTDYDMLERHKKCFTQSMPYKPRILKTNSKSKLVLWDSCYQVPRPKRKKKRSTNKKDIDHNDEKYRDDFELYDSSSDRNQESSSEHESIEEVIDSSLAKVEDDVERKIVSKISPKKILLHDNINSSFPNNNADSAISKYEYNGIKETKQLEDEDDTCYGSDHFGSDMMNEQLDASKLPIRPKRYSKDYGENSIDSAYTGSREPTPDICSSGSEQAVAFPKPKLKYNAIKNEKVRSASFVIPTDTVVQRINESKLFLLEKIKDTGLYSDSNINSLLDYYSRKWHHIPEREMKIIASFIRRDLGVKAPPKTYIDQLLKQSDTAIEKGMFSTSQFNEEFTTAECVTALSSTLPNYLKVFRDKRKAASTSCSPEPSVLFKNESNLNSYTGRYNEQYVATCTADFRGSREHAGKFQKSQSGFVEFKSIQPTERKNYVKTLNMTEISHRAASQNISYSLLSKECDDEEWIKNNVGEDILEDVKRTILNSKVNDEPDYKALSDDVEKISNDLCERFGIVL